MRKILLIVITALYGWSCSLPSGKSYEVVKELGVFPVSRGVDIKNIEGQHDLRFNVQGTAARLITSSNYNSYGKATWVLMYCHGNGDDYMVEPSLKSLKWLLDHGVSYACIQIQDQYRPPFTTTSTGWGNDEAESRVISLYHYLRDNFNFKDSVILVGGSMGGLTMGQIAYNKSIPVKFCIGIGAAPSLKKVWESSVKRRSIIRNSFGLAADGAQDDKLVDIFKKYDWYNFGVEKYGGYAKKVDFPDTYLYYGVDKVFVNDYGGTMLYDTIANQLLNAHKRSEVKTNFAARHDDPTLYEIAIEDSVFYLEGVVGK